MARLLACMVLLLSTAFLIPAAGQDQKDADKDKKEPAQDKKEPEKKDAPKADKDKKKESAKDEDDPKKDDKSKKTAKAKEPEEKLDYGKPIAGRLKLIDANSQRDFTIEIPMLDKKKVLELEIWKRQALAGVTLAPPQDRAQRFAEFQRDLIQKTASLNSLQDMELRGAENMKIRSLNPPAIYDDRGFLKKWTAKELAALKGTSKLPGYPADADALKPGQLVDVYLAKTKAPPPKAKGKGGLKIDDDDDLRVRPEVVMIVIRMEARPAGQ